jgi:hypothetical protein
MAVVQFFAVLGPNMRAGNVAMGVICRSSKKSEKFLKRLSNMQHPPQPSQRPLFPESEGQSLELQAKWAAFFQQRMGHKRTQYEAKEIHRSKNNRLQVPQETS